jgi:hypothetical protein
MTHPKGPYEDDCSGRCPHPHQKIRQGRAQLSFYTGIEIKPMALIEEIFSPYDFTNPASLGVCYNTNHARGQNLLFCSTSLTPGKESRIHKKRGAYISPAPLFR